MSQNNTDSIAALKKQLKEARRIIALYVRWEEASDIELDNDDSDIDSDSMLLDASFAAKEFKERWGSYNHKEEGIDVTE